MRLFRRPGAIEQLSLEARVLYTGFAVLQLAGFAGAAWLYADAGLGRSGDAAARRYLGDPESPGPAPVATELRFAQSPRQLLETFHFHIFSIPVVLLIVAHLFMLCGLSAVFKAWVIGLATTATLVHVVTPLGIRLVDPGFGLLMFPSALAMGVTYLVMTLWPVYEMWRAPLPPEGL